MFVRWTDLAQGVDHDGYYLTVRLQANGLQQLVGHQLPQLLHCLGTWEQRWRMTKGGRRDENECGLERRCIGRQLREKEKVMRGGGGGRKSDKESQRTQELLIESITRHMDKHQSKSSFLLLYIL